MKGAAKSLRSGHAAGRESSRRSIDRADEPRGATRRPGSERVRALMNLLIELSGAPQAGKRLKGRVHTDEIARIMEARDAARQRAEALTRRIAWARFAETGRFATPSDGGDELESRTGVAAEQRAAQETFFRYLLHFVSRTDEDFYRGMRDGIAALVTWRDEDGLRSRIDPSRLKMRRSDLEALRGDAMRALQVAAREGGDKQGHEEAAKGGHAASH